MNLTTVVELAGQVLFVLGLFWILGYPLQRLLRHVSTRRTWVLTPLLGLWAPLTAGWFKSALSTGGITGTYQLVLVVFGLISIGLLGWDLFRKAHSGDRAPFFTRNAVMQLAKRQRHHLTPTLVAVALFTVYVLLFHAVMSLSYPSPVTLRNYDAPFVSAVAESLRFLGFADPGHLQTLHTGSQAKIDVSGTFLALALPPTIANTDVWRLYAAIILSFWLLGAQQLALFIRRTTGARWSLAGIATVVGVSAPLSMYVFANGYLSQQIGIAVFLGQVTALSVLGNTRRERVGAILTAAVLGGVLWYVYAYLALVGPVLGLAIWFVRGRLVPSNAHGSRFVATTKHLLQRAVFALAIAVGTFVLSLAFALGRAKDALEQLVSFAGSTAGWTLPRMWPTDMFGFSSTFESFATGRSTWGIATTVVVLLLAAALFLMRSRVGRVFAVLIAFVITSHAYLNLQNPDSYQQWKWASAFTPLLVVASLLGMSHFVRRFKPWRIALPVGLSLALGMVGAVNNARMVEPDATLENKSSFIAPDIAALDNRPELSKLDCLNLHLSPWDTMWLTSFYPRVNTYPNSFYGYYVARRNANCPTLESTQNATKDDRVVARVPIVGQYQLVTAKPVHPGQIVHVDWWFENAPDDGNVGEDVFIVWRVTVTNTGDTPWRSAEDTQQHSVTLMMSSAGGAPFEIETWDDRQQLPKGTVVNPGDSYTFVGKSLSARGRQTQPQFDLLWENRELFEALTPGRVP